MDRIDIGAAMESARDAWRIARAFGAADLLGAVGLYRRSGTLPMIGAFATGLTVGIGAGMLLAPKSGADMRAQLLDLYKKALTKTRTGFSDTTDKMAEAAKKISDRARPPAENGHYVS